MLPFSFSFLPGEGEGKLNFACEWSPKEEGGATLLPTTKIGGGRRGRGVVSTRKEGEEGGLPNWPPIVSSDSAWGEGVESCVSNWRGERG